MKTLFSFLLLLTPQFLYAGVDLVDWSVLEETWRKPLCIEEAVYPLSSDRAKMLYQQKEQDLKSQYSVYQLESLAYGKTPPSPEVLESFKEILIFKGLELARSSLSQSQKITEIKKYTKSFYNVCSRILNRYPTTRCHDFLLINIKPLDFMALLNNHFETYKTSAIYLMDMQGQCRDPQNPDWNCSTLAKDYFAKNHLDSCIARQLEPPEKVQPISGLLDSAISN